MEDGMFGMRLPHDTFLGVVSDGFSAPFFGEPPRPFQDRTGGEIVSRTIESFFSENAQLVAQGRFTLEELLARTNLRIGEMQENQGLDICDAGELAGASFVAIHVADSEIHVVKAGDCALIMVYSDGRMGYTEEENLASEKQCRDTYEAHMKAAADECGVDRDHASPEEIRVVRAEAWQQFLPDLKEIRRRNANNPECPEGYAILNGQPECEKMWTTLKLRRQDIHMLIMASDGLMAWEKMKGHDRRSFVELIASTCTEEGLEAAMNIVRGIEEKGLHRSHAGLSELTVQMVRL